LGSIGSLDFAGGAVVHVSAGATALVAAILIGPRKGHGRTEMRPNNLPLSVCGAALMWVGWCGFASGQGVVSMGTVTSAFVAIQASAAAAALAWTSVEWIQRDKPTVLGTVSGGVAGLVAIAPAAGYVSPLSALVIGIGAGGFCYMVVNFVKPILGCLPRRRSIKRAATGCSTATPISFLCNAWPSWPSGSLPEE
jgi:ammonium transporter, Amt family